MKVMQANDEKIASLTSSANQMIQKQHYAGKQIHDVMNRLQMARSSVMQVTSKSSRHFLYTITLYLYSFV